MSKPYNPLEKRNLADSIVRALLESHAKRLSEISHLSGAGVYVIYYTGKLKWYSPVAEANRQGKFGQPIYIGKAIPKGGRVGGLIEGTSANGTALRDRLSQHLSSVTEATNLEAADFHYKSLMVDDIWIPLGENILIERYRPVWNHIIAGFGIKDPGQRRKDQHRSLWDVVHPGRKFAIKLGENPQTAKNVVADLTSYFATGSVPKRLKAAATKEKEPGSDAE